MTKIELQQVYPLYLEPEKTERSQVWKEQVSFTKGEKIQIVAPSGSGKTSFIHFVYGMRKEYSGKILFENKNIADFNTEETANYRASQMSIIFQDLRLFPDQTVMENIEVKRILKPFHDKKRMIEMAEILGIGKKLDKPAKTCSYGEQQRIAIIRSLQQPFDFLLMDEPFSHLDENNRSIAMKLINEEAAKRKAAIILADLKKIEQFDAEKILYL
jgi:ABC-type lipoprotein export system ATPase subunit